MTILWSIQISLVVILVVACAFFPFALFAFGEYRVLRNSVGIDRESALRYAKYSAVTAFITFFVGGSILLFMGSSMVYGADNSLAAIAITLSLPVSFCALMYAARRISVEQTVIESGQLSKKYVLGITILNLIFVCGFVLTTSLILNSFLSQSVV